ncbi:MAG: hypothetical protein ACRDD7_01170 [Peptostreptococcaceae bacterium]
MNEDKKKRAIAYSFATMLILVGVLLLIVIGNTSSYELLGLVAFFICLIPAVGIYVYLGCSEDDTKKVVKTKKSKKSNAISSAIWLFATSTFFIIGFAFDGWEYAWVCFLIATALNSLVDIFLDT